MLVKGFKQFNEEKLKSVTFTFGRFNPPTIGHEKLITEVIKIKRIKNKVLKIKLKNTIFKIM